jgi:ketosteroid isomerase-like protein
VEPEELEPVDDPLGDRIRAANARYALALSIADAETLCALFEPDGAIIDGSGPDVLGHEGLRDMAHYARERFAAVAFEIDLEWAKQDPLDPAVAHAAGTWRMAFVPRSGAGAGETARSHGRFAQRWHRGLDGTWRLNRDLTLTREDG